MEDFILREINKIGVLIGALLERFGLRKASGEELEAYHTTKTELLEKLDLDIDTVLSRENFPDLLIGQYGFSEDDLEMFAELLFDCVAASPEREEQLRMAAGIGAIYTYLDARKFPASFNRYYILKELNKYIEQ